MTKKGFTETRQERRKRFAENVDLDRERNAAADAAVDKMISDNVKRHGG